jgi:hypothetical protein
MARRCDYHCVDLEGNPREGVKRRDGSYVCDACTASLGYAERQEKKIPGWKRRRLVRLRTFTNRLESITPRKILTSVIRAMPSVDRRPGAN